ncbi:MAG TPA: ABC transporter ATP-binding protein [Candidatus Limnocylindrales bacterium]
MTILDARLSADLGGFRLDIELEIAAGQVVALLGPNGAGKTTALRALAGLRPLSAGYIRLAGQTLDEPGRDLFLPAERRPIGVVFQDYLLFPHLSTLDNVAFGPRRQGTSKARARELAAEWLKRMDLSEYAGRKPRQLSGGQAQRVALARALAVNPKLLLLDEPLAALDARTRIDTRAELHQHLHDHDGATLIVTHDPLDAMMLADHLVVIENGGIVQQGDAATITARPRTDYIARLVGLNLYQGVSTGTSVTLAGGFTLTTAEPLTGDVFAAFAPAAVSLYTGRPEGSPRNTWQTTITGIHRHGDNLRIQLDGPIATAADVTPAAAAHLRLSPGQQIWAAVKATEISAYPA